MKLSSNIKKNSENIYLEESLLDQEKKERKKIKLPKINKSYSNLYKGNLNKTVINNNDEEKTNVQNIKGMKFEKIDYAKKIKEANEIKELKQIYDKWLLNRSLKNDDDESANEQIKNILIENKKSGNTSHNNNNNNNNLIISKTKYNGANKKKVTKNNKKDHINVNIFNDYEKDKKEKKVHIISNNNSKLKRDNEKLNNALKEKEDLIEDLRKYKLNLESKIKELENNNYQLRERIDDFENNIKEKDEEILEIKKENEFLDKNGNNYKNKLDEILNEKNNLEIKTNNDKIKIDELNKQIKELKKNYNSVNKEKNKLNNKYISLNEDHNNLKEENKNVRSQNYNLNQENIDLNEKIKELEKEIKKRKNINQNNQNLKKVNKSEIELPNKNIITEENHHESSSENINNSDDRRHYNVIVKKDYGLFQNKNIEKNNNENDAYNSENSRNKFIETNNNNVILYEENDESNITSNNSKYLLFSKNNNKENKVSSTKNRWTNKDIKTNSEIVESNYNENINSSQRENQMIDYISSYKSKYKSGNLYNDYNYNNSYNNNNNNYVVNENTENGYNDLSKINNINLSLSNEYKDKRKDLDNSGNNKLKDNQKSDIDINENQSINSSNKYINLNNNNGNIENKNNNLNIFQTHHDLFENNKNINNEEMLQKLKSKKTIDFNYLARRGNLFSGKNNNNSNLDEKLEYISDLDNYLQEEIIINKDNNLLTPEEAVHYVDDIIIRFLGYFGSELCLRGIKTYIEKTPTHEHIRNIIFRIISSGIVTQKNYKLIIDNEDIKSLFEEKNEYWLNYLENIKAKISKRFEVNEKDIYYFGHKLNKFEVNLVIYNQRINGLESFLKKFGLKVSTFILLNYCILSPCIFESDYCKDEKSWRKKSSFRGGKVYEPPQGWYGIGLNIRNRYRRYNDAWFGNKNKEGEWAVAYHGIQKGKGNVFDKILKIMNGDLSEEIGKNYKNEKNKEKNNDKYPNCSEGVLLFPSIEDTEKYSDKTSLGFFNLKIQFAFMSRINTSKIRSPDSLPVKWILNPNNDEIRPYRLLIKIN